MSKRKIWMQKILFEGREMRHEPPVQVMCRKWNQLNTVWTSVSLKAVKYFTSSFKLTVLFVFFPLAVFWKRNLICHICWSGVNLLKPQRLIFCEFCHILSLDNHKLQWVSLCRIKTHRLHFCFFHKKTTRMKLFAFHFVKTAHAPSDWVDGICEQQLFESCPRVSARFLFGLRLGHPAT